MSIAPHPTTTFGFVDGMFVKAVADRGPTEDPDRNPDFVPAMNVIVTFTPVETLKKFATDPTMYLQKAPIEGVVANNGHLRLRGAEEDGVGLITGVYDVKINGLPIGPFQIEVLETHTEENPLDLLTALPYVPPPGTTVQLVPLNSARATTLAPGSEATADISGGVLTVGVPKGDPGEPGEPGPPGEVPLIVSETQPVETGILWIGPDHDVAVGTTAMTDTGFRWLGEPINEEAVQWASMTIRRVGSVVSLNFSMSSKTPIQGTNVMTMPDGFKAKFKAAARGTLMGGDGMWVLEIMDDQLKIFRRDDALTPMDDGTYMWGGMTYLTTDPWPDVLPGVEG